MAAITNRNVSGHLRGLLVTRRASYTIRENISVYFKNIFSRFIIFRKIFSVTSRLNLLLRLIYLIELPDTNQFKTIAWSTFYWPRQRPSDMTWSNGRLHSWSMEWNPFLLFLIVANITDWWDSQYWAISWGTLHIPSSFWNRGDGMRSTGIPVRKLGLICRIRSLPTCVGQSQSPCESNIVFIVSIDNDIIDRESFWEAYSWVGSREQQKS